MIRTSLFYPERLLSKKREKRDADTQKEAQTEAAKPVELNHCPLSPHIFGLVSHSLPRWKTSLALQRSPVV